MAGLINSLPIHRWEKSGNEDLAVVLSEWLLKERGVLRVERVAHHKFDPKLPPGLNDSRPMPQHYTILEEVVRLLLLFVAYLWMHALNIPIIKVLYNEHENFFTLTLLCKVL